MGDLTGREFKLSLSTWPQGVDQDLIGVDPRGIMVLRSVDDSDRRTATCALKFHTSTHVPFTPQEETGA
jgi:hypothetical protein